MEDIHALFGKAVDLLHAGSPELPDVAYHYTDAAGLAGMVTNRQLWASHAFCMNDPSEQLHAFRIIRRVLESHPFRNRDAGQLLLQTLESRSCHGSDNIFVFSLSALPDDLGQWRGYADDGRGVAIGFALDSQDLSSYGFPGEASGSDVYAVVYNEKDQREIVEGGLLPLLEVYDRVIGSGSRPPDDLMTPILDLCGEYSALFKEPGYEAEREVRIITVLALNEPNSRSRIRFRTGRFGITPYVPLTLDIGTIRTVRLGPRLDARNHRTTRPIELLLACQGRGDVQILASERAYR